MALTLDEVRATAAAISPFIIRTPTHGWRGGELSALLGPASDVQLKLEFLLRSGTFKARGALSNLLRLTDGQRQRGVTAVSAGNHAIAVAYAAEALGVNAKVVMQSTASQARIEAARAFGAEVVLEEPGAAAFELAEAIARDEGRTMVHPFDGLGTALGTATLGLEICEQLGDLDALLVAVGGGGLAGGVASVMQQLQPGCAVIGVEPEGADIMYRSFQVGAPQTMTPRTIADSLAPPMSLPFSYELCRDRIDQLVQVTDDQLRGAMKLLFRELKLAVEPACAATTAALMGPLSGQLRGLRVAMILCGSNLDLETFISLLADDS